MLNLSYELSQSVVSNENESRLYVLVKVSAPEVEEDKRAVINLNLALDRSGSMGGNKNSFSKQAASFVLSQLSDKDYFSLTDFDDKIRVNIPSQNNIGKNTAKSIIESIYTGGSTNLSGGWLAASNEALKNLSPEHTNRVILLTDGLANVGVTEPTKLLDISRELAQKGVTTSTIGFGSDFDEDLLKSIAKEGRGNFHYIDSPEKAPRIFSEELSELLTMFAQNLTLTIMPSEQVKFVSILHDFPNYSNSEGIKVDLGDIYSSDTKSVLLEFITPANSQVTETGISVINISYQQIYQSIGFKEVSAFIKVGYGKDEEVAKQKINPIVLKEMIICETAKNIKEAVDYADKGDLKKARKKIKESIDKIDKSEFTEDDLFNIQRDKLNNLLINFEYEDDYRTFGRKGAMILENNMILKKDFYRNIRNTNISWRTVENLKNAVKVSVIGTFKDIFANKLILEQMQNYWMDLLVITDKAENKKDICEFKNLIEAEDTLFDLVRTKKSIEGSDAIIILGKPVDSLRKLLIYIKRGKTVISIGSKEKLIYKHTRVEYVNNLKTIWNEIKR